MPFSWKQMRLQLLRTNLSQLGSKYITFNNRILEGEQKKKVLCSSSTDSCYASDLLELHSRSWESKKQIMKGKRWWYFALRDEAFYFTWMKWKGKACRRCWKLYTPPGSVGSIAANRPAALWSPDENSEAKAHGAAVITRAKYIYRFRWEATGRAGERSRQRSTEGVRVSVRVRACACVCVCRSVPEKWKIRR